MASHGFHHVHKGIIPSVHKNNSTDLGKDTNTAASIHVNPLKGFRQATHFQRLKQIYFRKPVQKNLI
jgi:hypothetical protein